MLFNIFVHLETVDKEVSSHLAIYISSHLHFSHLETVLQILFPSVTKVTK